MGAITLYSNEIRINSEGERSLIMKIIKNWDELKAIPQESNTHILEIDEWSGWIMSKNNKDPHRWSDDDHYLSTHTFYGSSYKEATELLKKCGFNVSLENWDKQQLNHVNK